MTTPEELYDDEIEKSEAQQNEFREFLSLLYENKLKTPNDFTVEMGNLIREARESVGLSQAQLAKKTNRRQATISDIENGKSEIGVLTLVLFAFTLEKPILYFFPESILKNKIADVKSKFEYNVVEVAREIEEHYGDSELTLKLLKLLSDKYKKEYYDYLDDLDDQHEPTE